MKQLILTQKPNGQWVYLPEDFLRKVSQEYFTDQNGLGFLPFLAPLVAGGGAAAGTAGAAGAASGTAKIIGTAIKVIPGLLKNQFWKDAGPAVDQLNNQAKSQLQTSQEVNNYTSQLLQQSERQNQALVVAANARLRTPERKDPNAANGKKTVLIVGAGVLLMGTITAIALSKKKKKSKTQKA